MLKIVLPFFKKNKVSIGIIISVSFVSLIVNIFISYYTGNFIDWISTSNTMKFLYQYIEIFVVLMILDVVIKRLFFVYKAKVAEKAKFQIYKDNVQHLNNIPIELFEQFNPTYLNQRLNTDIAVICSFFFDTYLDSIFNIIKIIIVVGIFFYINWKIAFVSLVMVLAYIFVFKLFINPIKKNNYLLKESSASYYQTCNEQLELYKEIRITSNFKCSINHIKEKFNSYFKVMINYVKISVRYSVVLEIVSTLFLIIIICICCMQIISHKMTIGELVIVNLFYSMLSSAVAIVCNSFKGYQETMNSVARLNELNAMEEESIGHDLVNCVSSITLDNVGFSYQKDCSHKLIDELSINFEKGKIYAITGNNGTGKTSLLNIILHFYRSNLSGNVYINNKSADDVDVVSLRRDLFAVCMQNEKLPDMTILEYLTFYGINDLDNIYEKICTYGMESMYYTGKFKLEESLQHKIKNLSGGEKQKICLLRVLLKDADVVILDEINSNLDKESIELLCNYMQKIKKDKIIIIISHNREIIQISDFKITL